MKAAHVDVAERTAQLLTRFNLSTVATELPRRLEDAGQREALGLVLEILEMEAEAREQRKIARLRRAAQLPPGKTWETLDHNVLPAALIRKLREIARGDFLEHAQNALVFGLPGVGKSHAACAIANDLIEQGHSVLFRPAYQLVQELLAAKRDPARNVHRPSGLVETHGFRPARQTIAARFMSGDKECRSSGELDAEGLRGPWIGNGRLLD
jgi:DNA replication protein DnaC